MNPAQETHFEHLVRAYGYSVDGLRAAWSGEIAFRIEAAVCAVALPLAMLLGQTGLERILLIGAVVLVLVVELLNSAVEAVVDLVSPDWHPLAKRAKDLGSAAVFVAAGLAGTVWAIIAYERFLAG
ncbi:diacylglycerol kinase [Magnetofaba australis]|uniref:Diacylglycerol kinase n=1 Tax=Magnetofaba australis IT-1 TaxID=1434232 RepID=A0A1Y2K2E8_9PROT|nr:diacylglycerol kinase [Magnetofaba australis]OSM02142.1 putative diacylglycerol kinase [Magnetofaba australis IT-1]